MVRTDYPPDGRRARAAKRIRTVQQEGGLSISAISIGVGSAGSPFFERHRDADHGFAGIGPSLWINGSDAFGPGGRDAGTVLQSNHPLPEIQRGVFFR